MAAFVDEVMKILRINTLFCMLVLRMLRHLLTFPTSSAETERSCSCIDGFIGSMFLNSGDDAASFLVLLESEYFSHHCLFGFDPPAPVFLDASGTFSCRLA